MHIEIKNRPLALKTFIFLTLVPPFIAYGVNLTLVVALIVWMYLGADIIRSARATQKAGKALIRSAIVGFCFGAVLAMMLPDETSVPEWYGVIIVFVPCLTYLHAFWPELRNALETDSVVASHTQHETQLQTEDLNRKDPRDAFDIPPQRLDE